MPPSSKKEGWIHPILIINLFYYFIMNNILLLILWTKKTAFA